jgi:hypothetical protein
MAAFLYRRNITRYYTKKQTKNAKILEKQQK